MREIAILRAPIEELELGVRAYNILKRHYVDTFEDLLDISAQNLNSWAEWDANHTIGFPGAMEIAGAQERIREMLKSV